MKVIFCIPYPTNAAPSQRFRFEQYLSLMKERGLEYEIYSFLSKSGWSTIYTNNYGKIIFHLTLGLFKRALLLTRIWKFKYVFIHREITPLGPPIFEWIIAKVCNKKIIYDFDDAIWMNDPKEKERLITKLKWKRKISEICKWSYKVSVGNQYLAEYARKYNDNVIINPTTIDTENVHNPYLYIPEKDNRKGFDDNSRITTNKQIIGWTGTHSTLHYLDLVIPVIAKLEQKYDFIFLVIANANPKLKLKSFQFIEWNMDSEIRDLIKIDIGIMPLTSDEWSKGKCGFKLLQFMALEKPVVASSVGVNSTIIQHQKNGVLCYNSNDWYEQLERLLISSELRERYGKSGRKYVHQKYSTTSNQANFLSLFE